jgi:hypothetical protein
MLRLGPAVVRRSRRAAGDGINQRMAGVVDRATRKVAAAEESAGRHFAPAVTTIGRLDQILAGAAVLDPIEFALVWMMRSTPASAEAWGWVKPPEIKPL